MNWPGFSKSRRLILAMLLCGLGMVGYLEWQAYGHFKSQQSELANGIGTSVSRQLEEFLLQYQRSLVRFSVSSSSLIDNLFDNPENETLEQQLRQQLKQVFPDLFAVTLTDLNGQPLITDFDGKIGELCLRDLKATLLGSNQLIPPVHPNPIHYHFDIVVNYSNRGALFASFRIDSLAAKLADSQPSGLQLFLIKRDSDNLIEVSTRGSRDRINRDFHLQPDEIQLQLFRHPIDGSNWDLLILQDAEFLWLEQASRLTSIVVISLLFGILAWLSIHAVSQEKKLTGLLVNANEKARKHAQEDASFKSKLLTMINRETRSPLNAINTSLDLLRQTRVDSPQRKHLETIDQATQNLLRTLRNIMLISEYDQLEQSQQPFRVDELLQAVARPHQRAIAIKKLHMEINNSVNESQCFLGSLQAMVQAINPIIENAVKFTEFGNITLEAGMIDDETIQFAISDAGCGMDDRQKQQLNDLFSTDETNHGQPYQSLGLGTAITKRLVEALHGEIRFDSSLHKGSVFYLRFPVTPSRCPEKSIPLDFNSTLPNYKEFPPIIPGHTIPASLLNRFTEALAESSIDHQAQREIVHWARKGGHQQWADSFQKAIDDSDLNSASQLIRQMILLQQSDESTIDKNIA